MTKEQKLTKLGERGFVVIKHDKNWTLNITTPNGTFKSIAAAFKAEFGY